jgi:hypothetical protein
MFCGMTGRSAGQMTADMPADGAAPEIIAAARPEADDHRHRFPGKGIAARLCRNRGRQQQRTKKSLRPPVVLVSISCGSSREVLLASCATFYERSALTPSAWI